MDQNLFNENVDVDVSLKSFRQLGYTQKFKRLNNYRLGTADKCCKNCENRISGEYHNKNYHKCKLLGFSNSEATDIRLKNVCNQHEKNK